MSAAASQAIQAFSVANLMDCYISQRKLVLPVVTKSERSSCEVTQRNFKKGLDPAHQPRLVNGFNLTGLTINSEQIGQKYAGILTTEEF